MIAFGAAMAAVAALLAPRRAGLHIVAPIVAFAAVVAPIPTLVGGAAGLGAWRLHHRRSTRRDTAANARRDVALLADLVALGVGAGLSFRSAVLEAADVVHPALRDELLAAVRRPDAAGPNVGRLFSIAARAAESGASIAPEAAAYAEELRARDRRETVARLRRLPVRLLFPLALLILPGFLLMALGPTLSAGLARLGI